MFKLKITPKTFLLSALWLAILALTCGGVEATESTVSGLAEAQTLALDVTHRKTLSTLSARSLFRVVVPEQGMISVQVSAPGLELPGLVVGAAQTESSEDSGLIQIVDRTRNGWILEASESTVITFTVSAPLPSELSMDYKMTVAFSPFSTWTGQPLVFAEDPPAACSEAGLPIFSLAAGWTSRIVVLEDDVDPWDCDVWSGMVGEGGVLRISAQGVPVEARVFAGDHCSNLLGHGTLLSEEDKLTATVHPGIHEFSVDPVAGSLGSYSIQYELFPLCLVTVTDDHGDVALCGSPLEFGDREAGILGNQHGDDEDVFIISTGTGARVSIEVESSEPVLCQALNEQGDVVIPWQECGGDEGRRALQAFASGNLSFALSSSATPFVEYSLRVTKLDG